MKTQLLRFTFLIFLVFMCLAGFSQGITTVITSYSIHYTKLYDEKGLFREDLLYRINTIQIEIPPLRERGDDILVLADFFLKKYAWKYDKPSLKLNSQAQEKLLKYQWPGNIRELEHSIEKAVILSENNILKPDDFFLRPLCGIKSENDSLKLEEMEKRLITVALDKNPGNISAAAEELGITRQTLYNKIKKFGLG